MARTTLFPARLYGIVDLGYAKPDDLSRVTREMIAGGVDVIQLRAKGHSEADIEAWGHELLPLCRDGGVPFIINDRSHRCRY